MNKDAVFSPDGKYRYKLYRRWGFEPMVLFIGLNPSTANARDDDPTIRRCIGFAKSWGYGGLWMGNLFAFVSTDPAQLNFKGGFNPIGLLNDDSLLEMAKDSQLLIAAWGHFAQPEIQERASDVRQQFPLLKCLG